MLRRRKRCAMTDKGTTERSQRCGSKDRSVRGKYASWRHASELVTCLDPWHEEPAPLSAPTSEPVRELVEALQKVCDAMRTFQRREQRSYFASDIFEAERVLA